MRETDYLMIATIRFFSVYWPYILFVIFLILLYCIYRFANKKPEIVYKPTIVKKSEVTLVKEPPKKQCDCNITRRIAEDYRRYSRDQPPMKFLYDAKCWNPKGDVVIQLKGYKHLDNLKKDLKNELKEKCFINK
jgi:hypothetical protein